MRKEGGREGERGKGGREGEGERRFCGGKAARRLIIVVEKDCSASVTLQGPRQDTTLTGGFRAKYPLTS